METTTVSAKMLAEQLEQLRQKLGDDAYAKARHDIAMGVILKPNGDQFLKNVFPDFDFEPIRKEAEARQQNPQPSADQSPETMFFEMIQKQIPSLKTQAHFNAFLGSFDALRAVLDCYFRGDSLGAVKAREALEKTLNVAGQLSEVASKVQEIPEEHRSPGMQEFVEPPKQFHEYDDQRRFLVELAGISSSAQLQEWYVKTRPAIDRSIVSQSLRNELFDAIRAKRIELKEKENASD